MAQGGSQIRLEEDEEYVEMQAVQPPPDPTFGIYFNEPDVAHQDNAESLPPTTHELPVGTYNLADSEELYTVQRTGPVRQEGPGTTTETSSGWSIATKFLVTMAGMLLLVAIAGLGVTLAGFIAGRIVFKTQ